MLTMVIIPAYNSEKTIGNVVRCASAYCNCVIVIDDGSTDNTSKIALSSGAKVVSYQNNRGKAYALRYGFNYSIFENAKFVVTLDSDGEHDPSDIPRLLQPLKSNLAVVAFGVRCRTHGQLWGNTRPTQSILRQYFKVDLTDAMCGFRAYSISAIENIIKFSHASGFGIDFELAFLTKFLNLKYVEVEISTSNLMQTHGIRATHIDDFFSTINMLCKSNGLAIPELAVLIYDDITTRDKFSIKIDGRQFIFSYEDSSAMYVLS